MTTTRTVILAATDGTTDDVLQTAAAMTVSVAGGELHLVHVAEPIVDAEGRNALVTPLTEVLQNGRTVLEAAAARVRPVLGDRFVTHLTVGEPWQEILQLATDLTADIIVVGSHRRTGIERFLLGSVSEQIVRKARCQVVVARPKDYGAAVPEIEPPCKDCVATQWESSGERLWCARHERRRERVHGRLHYETPPTYGVGSMLLRPES